MSVSFNGSSTKLVFPGNVRAAYPITMFGWVKPNSASVSQMAFGVADFGGDDELMGFLDGGGNGKAKAFARRSGGSSTADSASSVSTGWQPFMVVFTGPGLRACYYGTGAAGTSTTSLDAIPSTHDRFVIGCRGKDDTLWFSGEIAEVGIWSTSLGATEWDALKAGALPETVAAASLVEHWPLQTASDLTGLVSRTLTASNATTGASHPITRSGGGTAPSGTVTISGVTPSSSSAVVTYSYSAADQTGFEYRLNGGAAVVLGASPATISGLTASTAYNLEVRAVNASGPGAWSAVSSFSTSAAGDSTAPTLTGSVSFSSVTQTSYTASWPAGSDNVAVTGYEYQIGSTAGAWTDAGNSLSVAISGRTAGTTETVYVRAYDAAGNRSTPAISGAVTLLSAAATITVGSALYPIKYSSASVLNETGLLATVLRADTLASVLTVSGVACNAGVITVSNAALTAGTAYHLAVKTASGWTGLSDEVIAA